MALTNINISLKHEIKLLLEHEGMTLKELNKRLNELNNTEYNDSNLSQKINNETIRYTQVQQILDVLGYDIQWIKRK